MICALPTSLKPTIGSSSFSRELPAQQINEQLLAGAMPCQQFPLAFMAPGVSLRDGNTTIGVSEP